MVVSRVGSDAVARGTLEFDLIGSRVRIRSEDTAFLDALGHCFEISPGSAAHADLQVEVRASSRREHGWDLVHASSARDSGALLPARVGSALDLCSALNRWAVAADRGHCIFHAGAASRNGRAVLLPAGSGAGKSTITAGLVRRGMALHSDEVGPIDMVACTVSPYPRSLCLREDVLAPLGLERDVGYPFPERRTRVVRPAELGGARAPGPAELVLVVSPRFVCGAPVRLERLGTGEAVMTLMELCCSRVRLKTEALDGVIGLVRRLPCYRLEFSRLDDALDRILAEFDRVEAGGA